jgi:hypothetical protein
MQIPFGLYNETRDLDMLRTFVFLPSSVYNEPFRDAEMGLKGGSIYGALPAGRFGDFDYQVLYGSIDLDDADGLEKAYEDNMPPPGGEVDNFDADEVFAGSLRWNTPVDGLRFGSTVFLEDFEVTAALPVIGPFTLDGFFRVKDVLFRTYSVEYTWGNLVLASEYFSLKFKTYPYIAGMAQPRDKTMMEGWYISGTYRFTDWFEAGTYYSIFWPDAHDHGGHDRSRGLQRKHQAWLEDIALAFRFDINEHMIFKTEFHWMDGTANVYKADNPDGYDDRDWFYFASKLTFSF